MVFGSAQANCVERVGGTSIFAFCLILAVDELTQICMGKNYHSVSFMSSTNWPKREGFGALVRTWGAAVLRPYTRWGLTVAIQGKV